MVFLAVSKRLTVKYDMAGKSWSHNWAPKLVFRLFNMVMNNAYVMYKELVVRDGGRWESDAHGEINEGAGTCIVPARREHEKL